MEELRSRKISVLLEQENYEKLARLAEDDYRSISGLVRHLIRKYIREAEVAEDPRSL